jgi:transketolase
MLQPLKFSHKLAGNPSQRLQFATTIKHAGESLDLADPRATRALVALMDMNAVLGGAASHYGGPAAFAELMSAAHALMFSQAQKQNKQWHELFHFVNDAGHCENGLYALKANYKMAGLDLNGLKGFRSIESKLTGHGESHLFPEGVYLSNGPLGSALPQSQGLALAEKLAGTNRTTITAISDGACMEGEAREALAAIPGLAKVGKLAPFVMVISDNNTKLSGRIDKESFSMQNSFKALVDLGWKIIEVPNGHDLAACYAAMEKAVTATQVNPSQPVAIHAKTIKGIGNSKTAESSSGGHGFPLKSPSELSVFVSEIYAGEKYPEVFDQWIAELIGLEKDYKAKAKIIGVPNDKIQAGVSAAMIKAVKGGLPVVSVTSDLPGSTGVAGFRKEFPALSFDVGVAESNMISVGAGLSKQGFIPVVDTFAQFGVTKGALPLTMASLSQAPMICIFSHTGFQDAADGASHQALSYLAMVSSIPHVKVYCLACAEEAEALVSQAFKEFAAARSTGKVPDTFVFFLGRENFPKTYGHKSGYDLEKPQVYGDGTEGLIATTGSSVWQALQAQQILSENGKKVSVIHFPRVNPPPVASVVSNFRNNKGPVVFVEDHQKLMGFGQVLTASLVQADVLVKPKHLAVAGEFGQSAYNAVELYAKHGIDAKSIANEF